MRFNLLLGLILGLVSMGCASVSKSTQARDVASAKEIKSAKLVKDGPQYFLSVGNDRFYIPSFYNDSGFKVIESDSKVFIQFTGSNRQYQIGTFDLPVDANDPESPVYTSSTSLDVRVLKNKETKKFKATLCTHMGCVPWPHFEGTLRQLMEIQTMEGDTLCLNNRALDSGPWLSVGSCPK